MYRENLNQTNDLYVLDISSVRHPAVSITQTHKTSWMLHASILLPAAHTIDLTLTDHQAMAIALTNAIHKAYVTELWPECLNEKRIRATQLNGLTKLQQGSERRYVEGDPSFAMLLNTHERFVNAAADAICLARADKVEEAYAVLTGPYARANRQVVWLLKNLKQRIQTPKANTTITVAA